MIKKKTKLIKLKILETPEKAPVVEIKKIHQMKNQKAKATLIQKKQFQKQMLKKIKYPIFYAPKIDIHGKIQLCIIG